MSERRFTRLKASLSETAAKTRETVSRELRQSLTVNQESLLNCIDVDYEQSVRQWQELHLPPSGSGEEAEAEADNPYKCFLVPDDDIQVGGGGGGDGGCDLPSLSS